jgi:hypothetical protein
MRTKLLLTASIAALLLATGMAHATETYQCGDVTVILGARPRSIHITFETAGLASDKKPTTDIIASIKWKWNGKNGKAARLNGKRCRQED